MSDIVLDGSLWLACLVALLAGLVSFISPCVLPLLPGYLAYVGGSYQAANTATAGAGRLAVKATGASGRMLLGSVLFVLGFTVVFVLFLSFVGSFAVWLRTWETQITQVMGAVIVLLGIVFMGWIRPLQQTRKLRLRSSLGIFGAPLLGAVFALGWTPCLGPTLAVITSLSLGQGDPLRASVLGVAYCLGLGLPFILVAAGFAWIAGALGWVKRHIRVFNIIGGLLLIIIGVLMLTGLWTQLMYAAQAWVSSYTLPI